MLLVFVIASEVPHAWNASAETLWIASLRSQ